MLPIAILLKDNHSNKALLALPLPLFFYKEKDTHVYTVWLCCLFSPLTLFNGHLPLSYTLFFFFFLVALSLCCCVSVFSSCGSWASHCSGFSCCRAQALSTLASVVSARRLSSCSSRALELGLCSCGTHAPWHVESSWTRDRTHVPCTDRRIPIHCPTREVPHYSYKDHFEEQARITTTKTFK